MNQEVVNQLLVAMEKPNCKMLSVSVMRVLLDSGRTQAEITETMENLAGDFARFSNESNSLFGMVFSTNMMVWAIPEKFRSLFFKENDLSMENVVSTFMSGMKAWVQLLSEEKIVFEDLRLFYTDFIRIIASFCKDEQSEFGNRAMSLLGQSVLDLRDNHEY